MWFIRSIDVFSPRRTCVRRSQFRAGEPGYFDDEVCWKVESRWASVDRTVKAPGI